MSVVDWEDIESEDWPVLLLGNGASQNVSSGFSYMSLFDCADLSAAHRAVFDAFETRNFETVLRTLRDASRVSAAMDMSTEEFDRARKEIRLVLMSTLCASHIQRRQQSREQRLAVNRYLRDYHRSVFSTNYDLLLYWAIMQDAEGFLDFFWGKPRNRFDPGDTYVDPDDDRVRVYYLHGGAHLYTDEGKGTSHKRTMRKLDDYSILEQAMDENEPPALFVSEGRYDEKVDAIRASDYLRFAYEEFKRCRAAPILVFGHALSEMDQHIVDVVTEPARRVAVSVRKGVARRALGRLRGLLADCDPVFFWADTHPLGASHLKVDA